MPIEFRNCRGHLKRRPADSRVRALPRNRLPAGLRVRVGLCYAAVELSACVNLQARAVVLHRITQGHRGGQAARRGRSHHLAAGAAQVRFGRCTAFTMPRVADIKKH